ncbi:HNH endonuclease signature motif containing protein [Kribbella sindirgiensis]|uniref:HNH endonuclease signature motif containing protein n=1 Tax=Kribbella sindirgiensis TaxID=1124744 RepID=UPI001EDD8BE8|nr:HNH endonuclease signature motif containing protein [Kribbella sindirgiensis]
MAILDERPVWSMSSSEKLSALDATHAEIARLQIRCLHLTASLDTDGYAQELGARDTVQLLSVRYRLDPADVRRDLRLARALHKYPTVTAALDTGHLANPANSADKTHLNLGQADAIVSALEKVPTSAGASAEDLRVAEEAMVEAAGLLPPGDLRKLGKEIRERLDTDGPEPRADDEDVSSREALWIKPADRGVTFGGYLADENAELLQTLIFAGAKPHKTPDGERDPRPRSKRQADALTAILTTAAGTGTAVPGHGDIKPHITVTIDLEDLKTATNTHNPDDPGQDDPGQGDPGRAELGRGELGRGELGRGELGRGELVHGDTLSAAAVRRLACDAGIIPLVLGSNSQPLDVGTEHRFVTRAIRQALNTRDKGCIACGAPPAICEAHHITHWTDGGPTSLDNLALLCKRDHINVHQGRLTITLTNGHPTVTRPTWSDPDPPPLRQSACPLRPKLRSKAPRTPDRQPPAGRSPTPTRPRPPVPSSLSFPLVTPPPHPPRSPPWWTSDNLVAGRRAFQQDRSHDPDSGPDCSSDSGPGSGPTGSSPSRAPDRGRAHRWHRCRYRPAAGRVRVGHRLQLLDAVRRSHALGPNPGPIDTGWMADEIRDACLQQTPLGRLGTPQDTGDLVGFLCSPQGQWINAQLLKSNGGSA